MYTCILFNIAEYFFISRQFLDQTILFYVKNLSSGFNRILIEEIEIL